MPVMVVGPPCTAAHVPDTSSPPACGRHSNRGTLSPPGLLQVVASQGCAAAGLQAVTLIWQPPAALLVWH